MKKSNHLSSTFNLRALVLAAVPAYVFPTFMSFLSGYFLQKPELMMASFRTIGLSSLCATIGSFMILWQFDSRQILVQNKTIRSLFIILIMVGLGLLCTFLFQLQSEGFNILFSAFLGAAILTISQQLKDDKHEKN